MSRISLLKEFPAEANDFVDRVQRDEFFSRDALNDKPPTVTFSAK